MQALGVAYKMKKASDRKRNQIGKQNLYNQDDRKSVEQFAIQRKRRNDNREAELDPKAPPEIGTLQRA